MGVSQEQLNRVVSAARAREAQGFFARVKQGDQRAASLFVRLVAHDVNPTGKGDDVGWLSKTPGETNVDGYAEDAICGNANPSDLANVIDLVNGAGAPGASIGGSVKERRSTNLWVKPQPLTQAELEYLLQGSQPVPVPPPVVVFPPRNKTMAAFDAINDHYRAKGRPTRTIVEPDLFIDNEGIAVWLQQYLLYRVNGQSHAAAVDQVLRDIDAAWA